MKRKCTHPHAMLLLFAVLVEGCSPLPTAPTHASSLRRALPATSRSRFLAFGDSLTAGATSPALTLGPMSAGLSQSYPYQFQQLMAARYANQIIEVENAGKPAEAAVDGMLRFPGVVRAFSPEVVVLLHGVNDLGLFGVRSVSRVAEYPNAMARDARFAGAEVALCTLPPNRPGGFRATDPAVIAAYNTALREVARGEGALLVDFEREVDISLIGLDGLHPTEAGYARMAEVLFEVIHRRYELRRAP